MVKKRLVVALLSNVIYSFLLAYIMYTSLADREPNTWYESFGAPITILLIFTGVAYLLGGIPVSLVFDKYIKKEIIKFPLYLIAGFIVGVLVIMISFWTVTIDLLWFGLYGVVGSIIFFTLIVLSKKLIDD